MDSPSQPVHDFHVLIVGCGLGGLACAIGCRSEGLKATVLEQAAEISEEIGAGIQMPPNAARVMAQYNILDRLVDEGGAEMVERHNFVSYRDGSYITHRPGPAFMKKRYGYAWYVIHRADYMRVLVDEAKELGVDIRLSSHVSHVDCSTPYVELATGERIDADVVVGADGLNSIVRGDVLGQQLTPVETGDLAYRAIIPRSKVESLNSPVLNPVLYEHQAIVWWGPDSHAVLYPVRHASVFNLVLLVPDDLPPDVNKVPGSIDQMKKLFEGWDPILRELIEQVPSSLKWKLVSFDALETWFSGSCTLLGDACHPTLPYQAQGAAMAVEDGASIAKLVGLAVKSKASVPQTLQLYERLRKDRTMLNVKGARDNRALYHARDGEPADRRNAMLKNFDWSDTNQKSAFGFNDPAYQMALMGFDTVADAENAFEREFGV